jgi:hypothetical protein
MIGIHGTKVVTLLPMTTAEVLHLLLRTEFKDFAYI